METKKIFVAGAGLMGGGIAQVCAQAGYDVTMRDLTEEILEKSLKAIHWSVGKLVEKGRVEGSMNRRFAAKLLLPVRLPALWHGLFSVCRIVSILEISKQNEKYSKNWMAFVRSTPFWQPTVRPFRSPKSQKQPREFPR